MSARRPDDFYETPPDAVQRLLERLWLPKGDWLEPSAGTGNIIRAVDAARRYRVNWYACELNPAHRKALLSVVDGPQLYCGYDFLSGDFTGCNFDVAIANPPFSKALEFVQEMLLIADHVVALLRLNFLESQKRAEFFATEMPDIYVLPNRPSFTGNGTDRTAYAWFHWTPERRRKHGRITMLEKNPPKERKRAA